MYEAALKLGVSVVKAACGIWIGNPIAENAATTVVDLVQEKVTGRRDQRRLERADRVKRHHDRLLLVAFACLETSPQLTRRLREEVENGSGASCRRGPRNTSTPWAWSVSPRCRCWPGPRRKTPARPRRPSRRPR